MTEGNGLCSLQMSVSGKDRSLVRLRLQADCVNERANKSDYSLYSEEIATFGEDNVYNQADSAGFINLFGLPIKVRAAVMAKNKK